VNPVEIIAAILGVINVVLVARRSLWNYPFGLAMVALYAEIFFGARLYSDALLQIFFFVAQLYGWWNWSRTRAEAGAVVVETLTATGRLAWLGGAAVAIVAWGSFVARWTDASYPYWDASVAGLSVCAQILQSRRKLESWMLWIIADIAAIGLYFAKQLYPTTILYGVFLIIATWGLIEWQRARAQAVAA
jgi:nicotinamide mononucleotide transporter